MSCQGCDKPYGGLYVAGCRQCTLRDIAAGPVFFASMRAGKLTPAYAALLAPLGEIKAVHEEVKAAAKAYLTGATRA